VLATAQLQWLPLPLHVVRQGGGGGVAAGAIQVYDQTPAHPHHNHGKPHHVGSKHRHNKQQAMRPNEHVLLLKEDMLKVGM
jgi:hypothetical protein